MNALLHTHPPPVNKVCIVSEDNCELARLSEYIAEHERDRFPKLYLEDNQLIIIFKVAPDDVIRMLIEHNINDICHDAEIYWGTANYAYEEENDTCS